MKYPTSKIDDCAVICLFLDSDADALSSAVSTNEKDSSVSAERAEVGIDKEDTNGPTTLGGTATVRTDTDAIQESNGDDEESPTEDDLLLDDYSALEGVTRVNTLLNLPRYKPGK